MASNIDESIPPFGTPTTAGVRANFLAAKQEIEALQLQIGFADYNDSETAITPLAVVANVPKKLTNDKLGPYTKIDALPSGVTNLWDAVADQLFLDELPVNTMVDIRVDIIVTTTAANQTVRLITQLAIGDPAEFPLESSEFSFKTAGAHKIVHTFNFYIGSDAIRYAPGELRLVSDNTATVVVNGWYIRAIKYLGL